MELEEEERVDEKCKQIFRASAFRSHKGLKYGLRTANTVEDKPVTARRI